ncbi:hypothetical protein [Virgisporangium ochraceum]|uniref:Secreted protein n=1 Tax=Virgisporangium ochraceum TaxID=65505 RepID=A0A8J4A3K7_9ACTN|nr:hypothetical protein [Virgisporangium ochraceum]GIJ73598.1 hypothetical protein Voc01_085150 [Virgisporangium ochraceum]
MDRRGFLTAAAVVAGGVALSGEAAAAAPRDEAATTPRRRGPALLWEEEGGFVPAGYLALRPPKLAVYGDGLAVADAARSVRLRQGRLDDLLDFAVDVLSNRANGVKRPGTPVVADVPTTKFTARRFRTWSIAAEALEVLREHRAYPRPLYDLLDRCTGLRDQALRSGRPFAPDAVRLVVVRVAQPPATPVRPWPERVPLLVPGPNMVSRTTDLYGRAARAAARDIPHRDAWSFTTFRTRDARFVAAGWRRLLPHEQD